MSEVKEPKDTEVEDCADEIGGTAEGAYDLLIERREAALAVAIAPLHAEKESLLAEYRSIGEAAQNLENLLPATARVAQAEADKLMVAGQHEAAQVKIKEAEEAANAPGAMRARQGEIANRLEAIEAEKQTAARRIFGEWYEKDVQPVVRAAEHGLFITLLDGLRESFVEYEQRTGTGGTLTQPFSGLVQNRHIENLTAPDRSDSWVAGSRWYAGRTR
jgi:hypothetical protein